MQALNIWETFGARIDDVDLKIAPDADQRQRLQAALDEFSVIAFPGQYLTDQQLQDVSKAFGALDMSVEDFTTLSSYKTKLLAPSANGVHMVTNVAADGRITESTDARRVATNGSRRWHTDLSFLREPNRVTLLLCRETPPEGGNTEFADMYGAWDRLPEARQREIADLFVVHDWTHSRAKIGYFDFTDEEKAKFPPMPQPLVRKNPRTGRKHLYLASHASHIVGWPVEKGRALIEELMAHATQPGLTGSYHWGVGDLVIWDNASTMHRATAFADTVHRRVMARIGITEPGPVYDDSVMQEQIARMREIA